MDANPYGRIRPGRVKSSPGAPAVRARRNRNGRQTRPAQPSGQIA